MGVPLILTSPHSGNYYPKFYIDNLITSLDFSRSIEDMYVNEFIENYNDKDITILTNKYSRAVIDLNRNINELDNTLVESGKGLKFVNTQKVQLGIGLIPVQTAKGKIIFKKKFSLEKFRFLQKNVYLKWHENLRDNIDKKLSSYNKVFLIDLHSMPSENENISLPDFVLGNVNGLTCKEENISFISDQFKGLGYSVSLNNPYSGGYITESYFNENSGIQTLQIEINKKLYMDENRFTKKKGFDLLRINIQRVISNFTDYFVNNISKKFAAE